MIRKGGFEPYVKEDGLNIWAKGCGIFTILSIVLLHYASQKIAFDTCIFVFLMNWIVVYIGER